MSRSYDRDVAVECLLHKAATGHHICGAVIKVETTTRNPSVMLGDVVRVTGGVLTGDADVRVSDVTHDSRQANHGSLFVAIRGELFDAHKFVPQVIEHGAVGVLSELERPGDFKGAWIQVDDVRRAIALAAA